MPLLHGLTTHYSALNPSVAFEIISGDFQTVFDRLVSDKEGYILTNHLPAGDAVYPAWPIGQDGIAVIVQPDNLITDLTSDQLRRIYLGHLTNWNEVGGSDQKIVVLSREEGSGTRAEFEKLLMGDRLTTQTAQLAPSNDAMVSSVATIPGSIGYISMSYLDETVKALSIDGIIPSVDSVYANTYPLRATLFILGLSEPEDTYRAFIGWIQSPDGQEQVGQLYAPLLHP
jgi:phosphate transport system substrate-binding protein